MSDPNIDDLIKRLDSHPLADPPEELHPRIMAAVGRSAPRARGFSAGSRTRLATTFGLGVVAGVVLWSAVRSSGPGAWNASRAVDPSQVSGSMVVPPAGNELVESIPVSVAEGSVTGSVEVYRDGDEARFDVVVDAPSPVEWKLSFDPGAWEVAGVERPARSASAIAVGTADVHGSATGPGRVTVVMRRLDTPGAAQTVVFQVVQSGRVVFEQSALPAVP